ncbi:AraC family transcriptional regulator [Pseudomonas sp. PAGU 2196]|uniref:AraC family transcriptional regulator n=1 Tax=Pseudomonas sp. PAGU 2196 TaxID=2793997 RepID=UPI001EDE74C3|nr:AraC family transcriptional regulator [Pseudomonas sp. PAGU 2196]
MESIRDKDDTPLTERTKTCRNSDVTFFRRTLGLIEDNNVGEGYDRKLAQFLKRDVQALGLPYLNCDLPAVQGAPLDGPLRFLATSAPTVGHALVAIIRYMRHYAPLVYFRLDHRAGLAVLQFEPSNATQPLSPHTLEKWVVAAWLLIGELRGRKLKPHSLSFRHPPLGDANKYSSYFGCSVLFEQTHDCLIMPSDVLEEISVKRDAELHEMVRYFLELRAFPASGLKAQVDEYIKILLPSQRCTLEQVALALQLNPRTLQRRLANEAIDFEECLDHIRRCQAEQMLQKTSLSIGQISSELGYRRTTSFCRAHLRWFEMTPLEHRRLHGDKSIIKE